MLPNAARRAARVNHDVSRVSLFESVLRYSTSRHFPYPRQPHYPARMFPTPPAGFRVVPAPTDLQQAQLLRGGRAQAGFPSPAAEFEEPSLDLNRRLVRRQASTYFVICDGLSQVDAGILPGDILIVDRSLQPKHDDMVIAIIDDGWLIKKFFHRRGRMALLSSNRELSIAPIEITEEMPAEIWGVVMSVIHEFTVR